MKKLSRQKLFFFSFTKGRKKIKTGWFRNEVTSADLKVLITLDRTDNEKNKKLLTASPLSQPLGSVRKLQPGSSSKYLHFSQLTSVHLTAISIGPLQVLGDVAGTYNCLTCVILNV